MFLTFLCRNLPRRSEKEKGGKCTTIRGNKACEYQKGILPGRYCGTFGVPVEEHLKESEVKQIDGYVSMGILTGKVPSASTD